MKTYYTIRKTEGNYTANDILLKKHEVEDDDENQFFQDLEDTLSEDESLMVLSEEQLKEITKQTLLEFNITSIEQVRRN